MKPIKTKAKLSTPYGDYDVDVEYHWENDGIGSYEFWGGKGFDYGSDYPEIDDIKPIFTDEDRETRAVIHLYLEEYWDECAEQAANTIEKETNNN